MFSKPKHKSPQRIFSQIFSLKHISPSNLDKLVLLVGKGNSFSKKRSANVLFSFQLKDLYRLLNMKNLPRGKTTSREATPLGDPRGVPKQFSTFWCFSKHFPKRYTKHISKSLPIRLEGFRNRLKHSSPSVIQKIEVNNSVNILVLKTRSKNIEIQLNLNMDNMEHPLLGHLFDLIESTDFAFSGDEGPSVDLNELWSSLPIENPDNSNTVSSVLSSVSPSDDFLFPEIQSTLVESSGVVDEEAFVIDPSLSSDVSLVTLPTLTPVLAASVPETSPQFTISVPAHSQPIPMPQIFIQIPGTDQYQLVQIEAENPQIGINLLPVAPVLDTNSHSNVQQRSSQVLSLDVPSPPSPIIQSPSSPSPSSSPSLSSRGSSSPPSSSSHNPLLPVTDYDEMRRKNNLACKFYRDRKKTKQEIADEELKTLEQKNELLNMKVRQMESIIKDIRAKVITTITEPRVMKRESEGEPQPESKRSRWEP